MLAITGTHTTVKMALLYNIFFLLKGMVAQRWTVAVLCILTLFWPYCDGTTGPECTTVSGERTGVHPLPTVDSQMAEQTQRQHLEALFNRYAIVMDSNYSMLIVMLAV